MVSTWSKAVEAAKAEYKGKDKHKLSLLTKVKYHALVKKSMKTVMKAKSVMKAVKKK
jgi:hypothetical protein